jgi:hypothetical protein
MQAEWKLEMSQRSNQWARRVAFSEHSTVGLDFGQELWKWDVALHESAPGIRQRLSDVGRQPDDDSVLYHVTRTLLMDVVDAAGGVERAYDRVCASMAAAQNSYDKMPAHLSSEDMGFGDPNAEDAWYSLEEMIIWTRTLDDRLKRRGKFNSDPPQGLIPALSDGPRRDAVIQARSKLLTSTVNETREISELNLHRQPIVGGTKAARIRGGRVVLDFPDRVTGHVRHQAELTYTEGRDGLTFASGVMEGVSLFMDEMIHAFEANIPERSRREPVKIVLETSPGNVELGTI